MEKIPQTFMLPLHHNRHLYLYLIEFDFINLSVNNALKIFEQGELKLIKLVVLLELFF